MNNRGGNRQPRANKFIVVDATDIDKATGITYKVKVRTHISNVVIEETVEPIEHESKESIYRIVVNGKTYFISEDDFRRLTSMMANPRYS